MADGSAALKATNRNEWGRTASQYSAMVLTPGETKGIGRPLYGAYISELGSTSKELGLRILDIASGAGEPGLSLAQALPQSSIQMTDLAPEMLTEASRRAESQGIKNARCSCCWLAGAHHCLEHRATFDELVIACRFAVADAEDLSAYADGSFDVVRTHTQTCRAA